MTTRRRGRQQGSTLLEVLIAMVITSIVGVVLLGWMGLAWKESAQVQRISVDDNASSLLTTYLPRDVASASSVTTGGAVDCRGGDGAQGTVLFAVTSRGDAPGGGAGRRDVYSIAPSASPDRDGHPALWRRSCRADDGTATVAVLVVPAVTMPSAGWADAVRCDAPCRRLELTVATPHGMRLSATGNVRVGPGQ